MTDIVVTISIHGRDYRYRREQPTVFEFFHVVLIWSG